MPKTAENAALTRSRCPERVARLAADVAGGAKSVARSMQKTRYEKMMLSPEGPNDREGFELWGVNCFLEDIAERVLAVPAEWEGPDAAESEFCWIHCRLHACARVLEETRSDAISIPSGLAHQVRSMARQCQEAVTWLAEEAG